MLKFNFVAFSTEWQEERGAKVEEAMKVYRVITYLNTVYNQSIARSCVPAMKTCIEFLGVFSLFGALRFYRDLPIALYLVLPVSSVLFVGQSMVVISLLANINTESLKLGRNFQLQLHKKERAEMKYFKRVVTSCRPIQCRIGAPYFVERSTKIKYAGLLFDFVLTLLVTSKRS
jgi:hypothetical protein